MKKEIAALIKDLERAGYTVKRTKKNHWLVINSQTGRRVTTLPSTPSDPRSLKNATAALRRDGYKGSEGR